METPKTNTERVTSGELILPEPQPGIVIPEADPEGEADIMEADPSL